MKKSFTLTATFSAAPETLYNAAFTRSGWRLYGGSCTAAVLTKSVLNENAKAKDLQARDIQTMDTPEPHTREANASSPSVFSFGYSIGLVWAHQGFAPEG